MRFLAHPSLCARRRRAVTLIELLVVISIILIITGLSFTFFTTGKNFGDKIEAQSKDAIAKVKPQPEKWPFAGPTKAIPKVVAGPEKAMPPFRLPEVKKKAPPPKETTLKLGWMPPAPDFRGLASLNPSNGITEPGRRADRPESHFGKGKTRRSSFSLLGLERFSLAYVGPKVSLPGTVMSDFPGNDLASLAHLYSAPLEHDPFPGEYLCTAPAGNSLVFDPYPSTSAFLLHSNPGASCVIYMDFNGHTTVAGNPWNKLVNGGNPITGLSWSMDADRTTFSTAELDKIIILWRMVAEDFMPFDVDVTTEDPGLTVMQAKGSMRAVIGPTPKVSNGVVTGWNAAGGIAFLNTFQSGNDFVCWNWNGDSSANPENSLPITVSHEIGHTLGLDHDGAPPLGYYGGHGKGATGWGPIMGAPFNLNVTQWSKDSYPKADNPEDDLAIIVGKNGFTYRPDDHGDTTTSGTALNAPLQGTLTTTYGIIEKETDVDYFVFLADPGPINIQIDPLFVGPNLDVQAELYNSAGTLLLTSNPVGQLDATLATTVVDKGAFYVKISSASLLPILPAGYPTYGTLGNYRISGNVTPLTPSFDSFKTMNPMRWQRNPSTGTYSGHLTIANITKNPMKGKFAIVMTLPDPSMKLLSPAGVAIGKNYEMPFVGTIMPGEPMRLPIEISNPRGLPLLTGINSYVTDIRLN